MEQNCYNEKRKKLYKYNCTKNGVMNYVSTSAPGMR